MTLNKKKFLFLERFFCNNGIDVKRRWYFGQCIDIDNKFNGMIKRVEDNILFKPLSDFEEPCVLVLGDLNVDYDVNEEKQSVGGGGFNAWRAFGEYGYVVVLLGKIGCNNLAELDSCGTMIYNKIKNEVISNKNRYMYAFIDRHKVYKSCEVKILKSERSENERKKYSYDHMNANDYDVDNLNKILSVIEFRKKDYIFISSYLYIQKNCNLMSCLEYINVFNNIEDKCKPKIIIDIASYSLEKSLDVRKAKMLNMKMLKQIINAYQGRIYAVIVELNGLKSMMNDEIVLGHCADKWLDVSFFKKSEYYGMADYLVCRYGDDSVTKQKVFKMFDPCDEFDDDEALDENRYNENNIGYGDIMTVKILKKIIDRYGE
ncbi:MAG: hypothetical protein HGB12_10105 [Bacteroidetes bacterium]|nr:hypothetical protein [Bacteroidota bacterium]